MYYHVHVRNLLIGRNLLDPFGFDQTGILFEDLLGTFWLCSVVSVQHRCRTMWLRHHLLYLFRDLLAALRGLMPHSGVGGTRHSPHAVVRRKRRSLPASFGEVWGCCLICSFIHIYALSFLAVATRRAVSRSPASRRCRRGARSLLARRAAAPQVLVDLAVRSRRGGIAYCQLSSHFTF